MSRIGDAELRLPAGHGVRLVALSYLHDAAVAAQRLAHERDAEALHDFRVAVRRTRSWLRAFRDLLGDSIRGRDLKPLKAIASATNPGRDLEVQLEWLRDAGGRLRGRRREGALWMADHLAQRATGDDGRLLVVVRDEFPLARSALEERLSTFVQTIRVIGIESGDTLAAAIADRIYPHADALGRALDRVLTEADEAPAHQARIEAKRLRYLLEPAAAHVKGGKKPLTRLKALQEQLGTLHDAHVMSHELRHALDEGGSTVPRPALLALARRLREDVKRAFDAVHDDWLEGRHTQFTESLRELDARLRAMPSR